MNLLKSRIKAYTKKDGTLVSEHDDSRNDPRNKHYLGPETKQSIIQDYATTKLTLDEIAKKHKCSPNGVKTVVAREGGGADRRHSEELRRKVVERYAAGETTGQISKDIDIPQTNIIRWVRQAGINRSIKVPKELSAEMVRLYTEHQMSPAEIGNRLGISPNSVFKQIKNSGHTRSRSEAHAIKAKKNQTPKGVRSWWQSAKTGRWEHAGSITELLRMQQLDQDILVRSWSKQVPIIQYGDHRYLPDFKVEYYDGHIEIEEIKWEYEHQTPKNQRKWEAARAYCQRKGWIFKVVSEKDVGGTQAINSFKHEGLQQYKDEDKRHRENELARIRYQRDKKAGHNPSHRPNRKK